MRDGANNDHFVKPQIISVRNAGRNVTQYVLSTIRMPIVTPNGCIRAEFAECDFAITLRKSIGIFLATI